MKTTQVRTLCECQASLIAVLDENLNVITGASEDSRKRRTVAPTSRAFTSRSQVGLSFACPLCTRTVLRTFSLSKLNWATSQLLPTRASPASAGEGG